MSNPQIHNPATGSTFDMLPGMVYEYRADGSLTGRPGKHIEHLEKDLEHALKQIAELNDCINREQKAAREHARINAAAPHEEWS